MIFAFILGAFAGACITTLIIGALSMGKADDAYLQGRLDELADAFGAEARQ